MLDSTNEMSTRVLESNFKYLTVEDDWITIHVHPGYDYDIEVSRARTCKEICSWLGQIAEKTWGSKELLGELVMAFNIINKDLRGIE